MIEHINRLVLPLVISNILHMIIIKQDALRALARPVHAPAFGANKTWRGFVVLATLNALAVPLFSPGEPLFGSMLLGAFLGVVYMLFELPNSWLKRRSGIAPGASAERNRILYAAVDKTDSALGVTLAYWIVAGVTAAEAVLLFIICSAAHVVFSLLLVTLRVKRGF